MRVRRSQCTSTSAISVAFELGITTGYSDNTFRGHQLVSRQETASFITRTLGHTNVRPRNLTAQHDGMGGIQVSLRDANFAPVANEPIDVFRSYFPDYSFLADGKCETRYITAVEPSHFPCEIDEGDTVTDESGNKDYTASDLRGGGEDHQVVCGTDDGAVTFDLGSSGDVPAVFWVWTGVHEDKVNADTNLVKVDDVDGVARMGAQQPDHANVSGGLNSMMNQLEARMGTEVRFTLQLHGADEHALASPDASGNKYNLVVQVNELVAEGHSEDEAGDGFTGEGAANTRNLVRVGDAETYGEGTLLSRTTPEVVSPDSSGVIPIPAVIYPDPDRGRDNPDVVVTIELTAYQVGSPETDAADYNPDYNVIDDFDADAPNILADDGTAPDVTAGDGLTTGFETKVIFSDARPNAYMFAISADAPVYKLARGPNSPVSSKVDISALDQYGNKVRGLSVNAISDQDGGDDATGTSVFPFVQYFTTKSSGSFPVTYSYRGEPGVETLTAFAAIANQPYDHDDNMDTPEALRLPNRDTTPGDRVLEEPADVAFWNLLLPTRIDGEAAAGQADKPMEKVYWSYIGRLVENQVVDGVDGYVYNPDEDTGLLAVDVPNKALVVFHTGVDADLTAAPPVARVTAGPHVYYWDRHDVFSVGATTVSMGLFEEIVSHAGVTLGALTWTSYNRNFPDDTAYWTISCV